MLVAVGVVTLARSTGSSTCAAAKLRLGVDPSIDQLLPEGDEERAFYERARKLFGSDEFVLVVLEADDVFTPDRLERVQRISERVAALDGVHRVVSLANASDVIGSGADLSVGAALRDGAHRSRGAGAAARARHGAPDLRRESGLPRRGRHRDPGLLRSHLGPRVRGAPALGADRAIAEQERGDAQLFITGAPHVKVMLAETLLAEMRVILPAILAVAALFACSRSAPCAAWRWWPLRSRSR